MKLKKEKSPKKVFCKYCAFYTRCNHRKKLKQHLLSKEKIECVAFTENFRLRMPRQVPPGFEDL